MKKKILTSNSLFNKINLNINNIKYNCNTRFAPEGSGYLHFGHLKNIISNIDISKIYNGNFRIRIDDTNPKKNSKKFINYIKKDILWIIKVTKKGIKKIYYTSNYFHKLYQYLEFCRKKKFKKNKTIRKIKSGFYKEKRKVIKLKKYILYRIKINKHIKTNYNWFIYPLYNWAHVLSDKIENIKYSVCSIEFSKNRKIYNYIKYIIHKKIVPIQIEHSKLLIENNITSKRKINFLLRNKYIKNYKDYKLLTISSLRKNNIEKNIIYFFIKTINSTKNFSILNNNVFKKNILNIIKYYNYKSDNIYIIEKFIKIKLNYNKIIKFNTKFKTFFFNKILLVKENLFIKFLFNLIFNLNNFKKKIKLKHLKNIICFNYKKNNLGKIIKIYCKFINKIDKNKEKNIWINFKYKIKILIIKKNNIIKNENILNTKSIKKYIFYSENLIINILNNIYKNDEYYLYENYYNKNKNNKIKYKLLF